MLCNTTCNTKTSVKVGKMVIDTHKYNTKMIQYISPGPLQLRALFYFAKKFGASPVTAPFNLANHGALDVQL